MPRRVWLQVPCSSSDQCVLGLTFSSLIKSCMCPENNLYRRPLMISTVKVISSTLDDLLWQKISAQVLIEFLPLLIKGSLTLSKRRMARRGDDIHSEQAPQSPEEAVSGRCPALSLSPLTHLMLARDHRSLESECWHWTHCPNVELMTSRWALVQMNCQIYLRLSTHHEIPTIVIRLETVDRRTITVGELHFMCHFLFFQARYTLSRKSPARHEVCGRGRSKLLLTLPSAMCWLGYCYYMNYSGFPIVKYDNKIKVKILLFRRLITSFSMCTCKMKLPMSLNIILLFFLIV